ncbi:MAG: regulatory protein RecX [bacterium]
MEKALSLAYRFLSFRPRTVVEIEKYLQKKAKQYLFTPGEIQAALEILKDQGFLNDREFVKSFVYSRSALKPKSKRVLEMELKRLGVSQMDTDSYFSENILDENELAKKALQKKVKSLSLVTDEEKRFIKAISFLQRKGFSYDVAKKIYKQLFNKE